MNLILLGPPGSGKGTQSFLLQEKYGINSISTGELIRKEIKNRTLLGISIKAVVDGGFFPSDEIIMDLVSHALQSYSSDLIFDGFPRTPLQAEMLDVLLQKKAEKIDCVIEIFVDKEVLFKRLTGRFKCETCGKLYNTYYHPLTIQNKCDHCGGSVFSLREDDNDISVRQRLKVYEEVTVPVLSYYKQRGVVTSVNGMQSVEEVFYDIEKALGRKRELTN